MQWFSLFVLLAASGVLGLFWDEIPDRWTTHWGVGGRPDGWTSRSVGNVFWPLLLGAAIWVLLELAALRAKRGAGDTKTERKALVALRAIQLTPTIVLAVTAVWLPLGQPASPFPLVVFSLLMVTCAIGFAVGQLKTAVGRDAVLDRNADDERLWVPRKLGWSLNFGHPEARRTMAVLLLPPFFIVAAIIFCLLATRR